MTTPQAWEQWSAAIALAGAVVAVLATLYGMWDRQRTFQIQRTELADARERWSTDFRAKQQDLDAAAKRWQDAFQAERAREQVSLITQFHLEQYRRRLSSYPPVMKTLGAVSDVLYAPGPDTYRVLRQDQEHLLTTAHQIYDHLYGEAGLLMTMTTRNYVHTARAECLAFIDDGGSDEAGDRLVNAFYFARRYLRADLELLDDRSPQTLDRLVEQLNNEGNDEAEAKPDLDLAHRHLTAAGAATEGLTGETADAHSAARMDAACERAYQASLILQSAAEVLPIDQLDVVAAAIREAEELSGRLDPDPDRTHNLTQAKQALRARRGGSRAAPSHPAGA